MAYQYGANQSACLVISILGDPGAASRDDGIFMGESLQQEQESSPALVVNFRQWKSRRPD